MTLNIDKIIQSASKIKLTGGLIGRVCTTLTIIIVMIGLIAIKSPLIWVAPISILIIVLLAFTILWRVLNIVEKNPHAAIFDGAQFLKFELRHQSSKNHPLIEVKDYAQQDDPSLPAITDKIVSEANVPDVQQIEDHRK